MTDVPDLKAPNNDDVILETAIAGLMRYKLYNEERYWNLWEEAIEQTDQSIDAVVYEATDYELELVELYSAYTLEIDFKCPYDKYGVCMRDWSWTLLGGFCLFRDGDDIDTYRLDVYAYTKLFDDYIFVTGDTQEKYVESMDSSSDQLGNLKVSSSLQKYVDWFGCDYYDTSDELYVCKAY